MLPFIKQKNVAGVILAKRKPEGGSETVPSEGSEDQGLHMAASDLIDAVHAKDAQAVQSALRSAFQILTSESDQVVPDVQE